MTKPTAQLTDQEIEVELSKFVFTLQKGAEFRALSPVEQRLLEYLPRILNEITALRNKLSREYTA